MMQAWLAKFEVDKFLVKSKCSDFVR